MSKHESAHQDSTSAQRVHSGKSKAHPKTSKFYWVEKVKKPASSAGGASPHYGVQIKHNDRRMRFPLNTANKEAAAVLAAKIWTQIVSEGWDAAIQAYKPQSAPKPPKSATVGALIEAACAASSARKHSLEAYSKAFRRIVSEVAGIQDGRKFDALKGGTKEWRERVDAVPLASLLPADVQAWKNRRLRAAEADPLAKRRAITTVNSLIRNAKALFGKKVLPFVEQKLNVLRPLPFDDVGMEKGPSLRYVSKVDAYTLLARAKEELAESEPEAFKVLILALVCGLRRSEIDHLLWRTFDFSRGQLHIENTEYHQLKSEDSAGEIDLDADTAALFKDYRARAPRSLFVIESPNAPRVERKARHYRCNAVFERVNEWLRVQGVDTLKPLHTMRKEIGSIIASEHGIFEASRYLRHSDIRITSAIYADKKKVVTPKAFANLLAAPKTKILSITATNVLHAASTESRAN
ncbi:MAG: tyrosine-type recombinase/integrase [Prosthecobacter sp.]